MEIEMIQVAMDDDTEAEGLPDLGHAMRMGRTSETEQCLAAILQTPAAVMSPEQKFNHLWLSGGLYGAFKQGHADTAASFTRLVAAAPSSVLEPELQLKLLLWPVSTRSEFDVPLLHSIAAARQVDLHCHVRLQQQRTIFGYVHEVAASTNLSVAFKATLCAARHGNPATTAAQAAWGNDNPDSVAAMMCGILSASCDALSQQILLQSLGVSVRDVVSASAGRAHREEARWAPLLRALLDAARGTQQEGDQLI